MSYFYSLPTRSYVEKGDFLVTDRPLYLVFSSIVFFVLMLLPARAYQLFALDNVVSKIACNYLSPFDLLTFAFCLTNICYLVTNNKRAPLKELLIFFGFVCFEIISVFTLAFNDNIEFIFEPLSTVNTVFSALVFSAVLKDFTRKEVRIVFIIPFTILCASSVFLTQYGQYKAAGRTGTIGFGINETSIFSCVLFYHGLLLLGRKAKENVEGFFLIAVALVSVYLTKSRRGVLFFLIIIVSLALCALARSIRRLPRDKRKMAVFCALAVVTAAILPFLAWKAQVFNLLAKLFPAFKRVLEEGAGASSLIDEKRLLIYKIAVNVFSESTIIGYGGSSKLLANGPLSSTVHSHCLFIQLFCMFGGVGGFLISGYFVFCFFIALRLLKRQLFSVHRMENESTPWATFYFFWFLYEGMGYSLWNPKMLFLVATISFRLIRESSKRLSWGIHL